MGSIDFQFNIQMLIDTLCTLNNLFIRAILSLIFF